MLEIRRESVLRGMCARESTYVKCGEVRGQSTEYMEVLKPERVRGRVQKRRNPSKNWSEGKQWWRK